MMLKILGVVVLQILVYTLLKQFKPEFAVISEFLSLAVIIFMLGDEIRDAVKVFSDFFGQTGIRTEYIAVLIKVSGIAIITQLASDMCKDSGEAALSSKVEFAGKILITAAGIPIIKGFTGFVAELVKNV